MIRLLRPLAKRARFMPTKQFPQHGRENLTALFAISYFDSSPGLFRTAVSSCLSSAALESSENQTTRNTVEHQYSASLASQVERLKRIRNVGILAHVDAGKTTVTERMLALAGVVHRAGSVDTGDTVTDFLPAERERGITIQSAAISFEWKTKDNVTVHLIDTPGHVDFSVEVNRSVAVLDGAVLVVDAVAGVQAQTETVWRALRRPWVHSFFTNNHLEDKDDSHDIDVYDHEPLPCLALVNKMDKDGSHFGNAIQSLKNKLQGANPIPIQIPLFWTSNLPPPKQGESFDFNNIVAVPINQKNSQEGSFVGTLDLVNLRLIVWPDVPMSSVGNIEQCSPMVFKLDSSHEHLLQAAKRARTDLIAALADVDETMADYFLMEDDPPNTEIHHALRRATLSRKALPVLASAALRGKGVEPVLDAVADFLPHPLDRMPPALLQLDHATENDDKKNKKKQKKAKAENTSVGTKYALGHPLHPSLLAMAFKVIHMKGRGGSGDGRVVFARVYSGKLQTRDTVKCITPVMQKQMSDTSHHSKPRVERIGAMLELAGGRFDNLEDGICYSGDVCALVGLKTVVTGDTILLQETAKHSKVTQNVCLAGVAAPRPVLTVRLEVENSQEEAKLSHALACLTVEDPSLVVEQTESTTLLSGLGELHIEVTADRLMREYGIAVSIGAPSVAYRETVTQAVETDGLYQYDRTIGGTRLEGSVHLRLEPMEAALNSHVLTLQDPVVVLGPQARSFLEVDPDDEEDEIIYTSEVAKALIAGLQGALRRGALGPYALGNVKCTVINVDAKGGLSSLQALPGSIRAAAANAVTNLLSRFARTSCSVMEPTMSVEVTAPSSMVGSILSDLNTRRGLIGDVVLGDNAHSKTLIRADVPLAEILGYAGSLRSLTGGEATFTAEYKGHVLCDKSVTR